MKSVEEVKKEEINKEETGEDSKQEEATKEEKVNGLIIVEEQIETEEPKNALNPNSHFIGKDNLKEGRHAVKKRCVQNVLYCL